MLSIYSLKMALSCRNILIEISVVACIMKIHMSRVNHWLETAGLLY
jgi:hypothetical protein